MTAETKNLPASAQARLKNPARGSHRPYDELFCFSERASNYTQIKEKFL